MGIVIHRLVGLACIRKLIEQARKNNPISSLHPHLCFNSCLKVIVWVPALTSNINTLCYKTVSQINTFSLKLFLVSMFITATESKLEYCLGSELQRLLQRHMWIHLIMYANYFLSLQHLPFSHPSNIQATGWAMHLLWKDGLWGEVSRDPESRNTVHGWRIWGLLGSENDWPLQVTGIFLGPYSFHGLEREDGRAWTRSSRLGPEARAVTAQV